jgi:hypothetical protein
LVYGTSFFISLPTVAVVATIYKVFPLFTPSFSAFFVLSFLVEEETVSASTAFWDILC